MVTSFVYLSMKRQKILSIVIVPMDHIHGVQLCRLILDLKPRTAVDLRHLIRFDLPGTSRTEIFHHLKNAHTLYVKASLPWHELQPRDFITDGTPLSQRLNHEVVERKDSPVLLFASKKDEARYLTAYFIASLRLKQNILGKSSR